MIEHFIFFGMVCAAPFDTPTVPKCMYFYEEPRIYYENKEKCDKKAKEFSENLEINLHEKNLFILDMQLFCQPIKKVDTPA
jgi:hypothetical protein